MIAMKTSGATIGLGGSEGKKENWQSREQEATAIFEYIWGRVVSNTD